jgi:MFS family permease
MTAFQELRQGWRIVLGSLFGIAFGVTGLLFYSTGIFLKPVAQEFGWSRAAASTVNLVAALALAITAPFVGRLVDRFGARTVAFMSSLGLAVGFFALSRSPASLPIYLLLVGLTVLLGSGASPVAYTRLINTWFDQARGTALGLAQMATGLAAALLPVLLVPYIAQYNWRNAFIALGFVALLSAPAVLLLIGRAATAPVRLTAALNAASGVTLKAAVRTSAFLTTAAMLAFAAVGVSGIIVHMIPLLSDAGVPPARASAIAGLLGVGVIVGRALTGIFGRSHICSARGICDIHRGGNWMLAIGVARHGLGYTGDFPDWLCYGCGDRSYQLLSCEIFWSRVLR